jgi:hypothetical protein
LKLPHFLSNTEKAKRKEQLKTGSRQKIFLVTYKAFAILSHKAEKEIL